MTSRELLESLPKVHYTKMGAPAPGYPLSQELGTYQQELPRLLAEGFEGKVVLIKGNEIIGFFAEEDEAFRAGRAKFLMQDFMVQRVREWEPVARQYFSRLICLISPSP